MYFVFMYCIYWNYLLLVLVGLVQGMKPHVTHRNHRVGIVRARRCVQNSLEFFLQKQSVKWHLGTVCKNIDNQGCGAGAGAGLFWPNWSRSREIATAPAPDQALKMAFLTSESM